MQRSAETFRPTYDLHPGLPFSLGLDMPFGEGHMDGGTPRWSDLLAMGRTAEQIGFDVLWVSDHTGFVGDDDDDWKGCWEAWTVLSALAASTSRVQLGNYVLAIPYRNPALLAKMAETLDEISGGRVILAIGAGWNKPEFDRFDFPFTDRFDRFDDAIRIICSMLRTGKADYTGKVVSAHGAEIRPRGPRLEGLPVMVGASGPRMLRLTAELADAWDGGSGGLDESRQIVDKMNGVCREVGRDPATLATSLEAVVRTIPSTGPLSHKQELRGSVEDVAETLLRYADLRIRHLVVTVEPQTVDGLRAFEPVIKAMTARARETVGAMSS